MSPNELATQYRARQRRASIPGESRSERRERLRILNRLSDKEVIWCYHHCCKCGAPEYGNSEKECVDHVIEIAANYQDLDKFWDSIGSRYSCK